MRKRGACRVRNARKRTWSGTHSGSKESSRSNVPPNEIVHEDSTSSFPPTKKPIDGAVANDDDAAAKLGALMFQVMQTKQKVAPLPPPSSTSVASVGVVLAEGSGPKETQENHDVELPSDFKTSESEIEEEEEEEDEGNNTDVGEREEYQLCEEEEEIDRGSVESDVESFSIVLSDVDDEEAFALDISFEENAFSDKEEEEEEEIKVQEEEEEEIVVQEEEKSENESVNFKETSQSIFIDDDEFLTLFPDEEEIKELLPSNNEKTPPKRKPQQRFLKKIPTASLRLTLKPHVKREENAEENRRRSPLAASTVSAATSPSDFEMTPDDVASEVNVISCNDDDDAIGVAAVLSNSDVDVLVRDRYVQQFVQRNRCCWDHWRESGCFRARCKFNHVHLDQLKELVDIDRILGKERQAPRTHKKQEQISCNIQSLLSGTAEDVDLALRSIHGDQRAALCHALLNAVSLSSTNPPRFDVALCAYKFIAYPTMSDCMELVSILCRAQEMEKAYSHFYAATQRDVPTEDVVVQLLSSSRGRMNQALKVTSVARKYHLLSARVFAEVVALCVDSTQNYSNFIWRLYTSLGNQKTCLSKSSIVNITKLFCDSESLCWLSVVLFPQNRSSYVHHLSPHAAESCLKLAIFQTDVSRGIQFLQAFTSDQKREISKSTWNSLLRCCLSVGNYQDLSLVSNLMKEFRQSLDRTTCRSYIDYFIRRERHQEAVDRWGDLLSIEDVTRKEMAAVFGQILAGATRIGREPLRNLLIQAAGVMVEKEQLVDSVCVQLTEKCNAEKDVVTAERILKKLAGMPVSLNVFFSVLNSSCSLPSSAPEALALFSIYSLFRTARKRRVKQGEQVPTPGIGVVEKLLKKAGKAGFWDWAAAVICDTSPVFFPSRLLPILITSFSEQPANSWSTLLQNLTVFVKTYRSDDDDDDNRDIRHFELNSDDQSLLARLAGFLLLRCKVTSKWAIAYEVLHVLHVHGINYLGLSSITKENEMKKSVDDGDDELDSFLFTYLAVEVCIESNQNAGAIRILDAADWAKPELDVASTRLHSRLRRRSDVLERLFHSVVRSDVDAATKVMRRFVVRNSGGGVAVKIPSVFYDEIMLESLSRKNVDVAVKLFHESHEAGIFIKEFTALRLVEELGVACRVPLARQIFNFCSGRGMIAKLVGSFLVRLPVFTARSEILVQLVLEQRLTFLGYKVGRNEIKAEPLVIRITGKAEFAPEVLSNIGNALLNRMRPPLEFQTFDDDEETTEVIVAQSFVKEWFLGNSDAIRNYALNKKTSICWPTPSDDLDGSGGENGNSSPPPFSSKKIESPPLTPPEGTQEELLRQLKTQIGQKVCQFLTEYWKQGKIESQDVFRQLASSATNKVYSNEYAIFRQSNVLPEFSDDLDEEIKKVVQSVFKSQSLSVSCSKTSTGKF